MTAHDLPEAAKADHLTVVLRNAGVRCGLPCSGPAGMSAWTDSRKRPITVLAINLSEVDRVFRRAT